jgi:hypothetical protein
MSPYSVCPLFDAKQFTRQMETTFSRALCEDFRQFLSEASITGIVYAKISRKFFSADEL